MLPAQLQSLTSHPLTNCLMSVYTSPRLVRDLMTVGVTTCPPDTPIIEIAKIMLEKDLEGVVILEDGNATGMISQDELVAAYSRDEIQDLKAVDIMREDIPQVPADIPLKAAAQIMQDQGVRVMYLTHHAAGITYPAALISYRHLVRYLAASNKEELGDLGIKAKREAPLDSFIKRRDKARADRQTHK